MTTWPPQQDLHQPVSPLLLESTLAVMSWESLWFETAGLLSSRYKEICPLLLGNKVKNLARIMCYILLTVSLPFSKSLQGISLQNSVRPVLELIK